MTTKKKEAVAVEIEPQQTDDVELSTPPEAEEEKPDELAEETVRWATPGTTLDGGYVPDIRNNLVWVDVDWLSETDEEGKVTKRRFPDFRVGISIGIALRVFGGDNAPGKTSLDRACRRMSVIAPSFENWPLLIDPLTMEPVPCPDPSHPESYRPLAWSYSPFVSLGSWILASGWRRALDIATKN